MYIIFMTVVYRVLWASILKCTAVNNKICNNYRFSNDFLFIFLQMFPEKRHPTFKIKTF